VSRTTEQELEHLRAEAEARARQQEVLAALGVRALSAIDLDEILRHGLREMAHTLGVPLAAVFEAVPGSEWLVVRVGHGWNDGVVGQLIRDRGYESLGGQALDLGEPLVVDWPTPAAAERALPLLRDHGVQSGVHVMLAAPDGPKGVLGVYSSAPRAFDREDVLFVQGVANILAAAISRRSTEEDLIQSQVRLQSVQKMEAIGRLAGGIAHDFNNLVQAIGGYTEILLKRLPPGEGLHHYAFEIRRAGDRAAALTRQLLAFSRQQVLQPRVLDLNAVVANVEHLLRRLIGEHIELETVLASDLGAIKADATQLDQVLVNLAVNSRDAMPGGGTLTIETRNVALSKDDQREAFAIRTGPYVMLAVTDTGCGMDAETRARAFEPFFTTKAAGQGSGLGLSTVYGIVKQSDGYIWLDSEPGTGTRVRIYLPRVDEPVETVEPRPAVASPAVPGGSETLLLVEDEAGVREVIVEWLTGHGYTVLTAQNGVDALAVAASHAARIDLMIADVVMPQMGGPELAGRLLPLRPGLKVIYVSGYADEAIGDPGKLSAGAAFLQKPFSLDALLRSVRDTLGPARAED
jgi:signal transduction histidine kinase/ActR/RegA family two-component response regulator